MPKECFVERTFAQSSLDLIAKANAIIAEYIRQGFILTLRQLYYQMVARAILENKTQSYKRLGSILNDARLAGLVDWSALEDRTRGLKGNSHWGNAAEIIESAAHSFKLDKWEGQAIRPELWVEKEALAGVVERAALQNDLYYLSCRGYMSASEMYEAYKRILQRRRDCQETVIIYLGDHDPSGIDMSNSDIPNRFRIFMEKHCEDPVEVKRIALNWEQIDEYNPPPNPAKETDSRFSGYQEQFGDESWELDALDPNVLLALIQEAVDEMRDDALYDAALAEEEEHKALLMKASQNWDGIVKSLDQRK